MKLLTIIALLLVFAGCVQTPPAPAPVYFNTATFDITGKPSVTIFNPRDYPAADVEADFFRIYAGVPLSPGETGVYIEITEPAVQGKTYKFSGSVVLNEEPYKPCQNGGTVTITNIDKAGRKIEGTFELDACHMLNGEVINVRNGKFSATTSHF